MEELLDGLDCRLRVSGRIGDSIMMGIVSSAMEEAYERIVCTREGGLECLNDKSRFCGLAIMQLEWCLRLLQEEVEACAVESDDERQKLVGDLRATRDRIRMRLEETESAIAEKERLLVDMNEGESELKRELESKDEELRSLRTSLELERARHGGVQEEPAFCDEAGGEMMIEDGEVAFTELRMLIVQQIDDLSCKLVKAKTHISDLIQKLGIYYFSAVEDPETNQLTGVEQEGHCLSFHKMADEMPNGDRVVQISDTDILRCKLRTDLDSLFKQLSLDVDTLKRRVLLAFGTADEAVYLSKTAVDEQHTCWAFEKETLGVLLANFLKDVEEHYHTKSWGETPAFLNGSWSSLMKDFATLHSDLGQVAIQLDKQLETSSFVSPTSHSDDFAKENSVGKSHNHTDEIEQNHGFSVRKKKQEATWRGVEISRDQRLPFFCNGRELRSMKTRIIEIILKLECLLGHNNTKIAVVSDDHGGVYGMGRLPGQDNLSSGSAQKVNEVVCTSTGVPKQVNNETTSHCMAVDIREIRHLEEDREDSNLKSMVLEEINAIFLDVFFKELYLEFVDYKLETLLREDVYRLIIKESMKERNHEIETLYFEEATMEEINKIVLGHLIKEIRNSTSLSFKTCGEEYLSFQGPWIDEDIVHGADKLFLCYEIEEDPLPKPKSEIMESDIHFMSNSQTSAEQIFNHDDTLDEDVAFYSVRSKLEKALQQITRSKVQLMELGSDLGISFEEKEHAVDKFASVKSILEQTLQQITRSKMQLTELGSDFGVSFEEKECAVDKLASVSDIVQDREQTSFPNIKNREEGCNKITMQTVDSILTHLRDFAQDIVDLELVVYEKTRANMSRLEGLNYQLNLLVKQASSLRRTELLYRKAFIRRCCNLQIAEAEVDLLGDEVDALLHLLEKIYIALDHYSPVLQYYRGIMDILKLIKKELFGDAPTKSHNSKKSSKLYHVEVIRAH